MEKNHRILKEEFPVTEEQITSFESSHNIHFPKDYRAFLLKYNGGVAVPSFMPSGTMLERFQSLQDIEFGIKYHPREKELRQNIARSLEGNGWAIDCGKLLFIGMCEGGGYLHLYCGEKQHGAIYESNYSGGDGFWKTEMNSFTDLLNGLHYPYDDWTFDKNDPVYQNHLSNKIFQFGSFYWKKEIREKSLERFKEVLSFYGSPLKELTGTKQNVVGTYINNPTVLEYLVEIGTDLPKDLSTNRIDNLESLKFLISQGAATDGVLLLSKNPSIIKYLLEDRKEDINKAYQGKYPMIALTNINKAGSSSYQRMTRYELIKTILALDIEIDLNLKDEQGRTIKERIEIVKGFYDEYHANRSL